ncbi:MAG: carbohydrate ABC transporter permease [Negativicutes bacterium]|jgi:multiple sugar transport system permease protein|nr:carbohydrate ABC transporter permease [Negativicutes bacterium]
MIRKSPFEKVVIVVLTVLVFAFFMIPLYWLLTTSLKYGRDAFTLPPQWLFFIPTLHNYVDALTNAKNLMFIKNSLIITTGTTLLSLGLGVPAGYAIARTRWKLLNSSSFFFLILLMAPPVATLIPFYLIMRDVHLLGTYWALILLDTAFDASFVVWMMRSYFKDVPQEMEEAALVDGASHFTAFLQVALPLSIPGIISSALYCIIYSWNDFLFALMLTSPATKTIPLGIMASFSAIDVSWGQMTTLSVFAIIPAVIISIFLNRYFVQGLTMGASKG